MLYLLVLLTPTNNIYWGEPERAPHCIIITTRYLPFLCMCAIRRPRVVLAHAHVLIVTFNVDDHFHLEMIVTINIIIPYFTTEAPMSKGRGAGVGHA